MTKLTAILSVLLALVCGGCVYGPEHLPALCAQRDVFQREIDGVLKRMRTDVEWWRSLTPERRAYWKQFMEKSLADERDRALTSVEALSEGLATAASVEPASPRP